MADDEIGIDQLPDYLKMAAPVNETDDHQWATLAEMEKKYIEKVLLSVGGNKTKAAEILGIDRKTLRGKVG
jgi:two-component system response regulator HydG